MADNHPRPPETSGAGGSPRRGLGRGLGALIPGADTAAEPAVVELPVDRIRPNSLQPRVGFDREPLVELEASIREHGVLQPVLVRPAAGGYELIAGERRWRAATAAGLRTVPAMVRHLDDRGALEAALVENLQRQDLSPIERAGAYRRLMDDFRMTQEAVAGRVGRSQSSVANTIRLLALPSEVQASLEAGRITEGHARALLAIEDRKSLLAIWREVEKGGLSVRATETAARRQSISREMRATTRTGTQEINIIEQKISEMVGAPVRVSVNAMGGGEIRITFFSPADLDRLIETISGRRPGVR